MRQTVRPKDAPAAARCGSRGGSDHSVRAVRQTGQNRLYSANAHEYGTQRRPAERAQDDPVRSLLQTVPEPAIAHCSQSLPSRYEPAVHRVWQQVQVKCHTPHPHEHPQGENVRVRTMSDCLQDPQIAPVPSAGSRRPQTVQVRSLRAHVPVFNALENPPECPHRSQTLPVFRL
uniref:(northern house mosquito) hypothetical protein n=1 Tax=Culex pipiens TaxID=7175 RepID=A0A8D8ACI8_CULPI